jgi:UPF0271 protein
MPGIVPSVDLNADLGEEVGDDEAMLALVSSASIACGAHAGGPDAMFAVLKAAKHRGVVAGAHPGYPDRASFGRRVIPMSAEEISRMIAAQIGAIWGVARLSGNRIAYVKPHGALYNLAAVDAEVARAICLAMRLVDPAMPLLCASGSVTEAVAREMGLAVAVEIFADRAYRRDGRLVPRDEPGAVIHEPEAVIQRVLGILRTGSVTAVDGSRLPLRMDSICLHGDTPGSVALARALRRAIEAEGWRIEPFVDR